MPSNVKESDTFWSAFKALKKSDRQAVIERLLEDGEFIEDLIDTVLIEQRRSEPSRPLEEYLAERK